MGRIETVVHVYVAFVGFLAALPLLFTLHACWPAVRARWRQRVPRGLGEPLLRADAAGVTQPSPPSCPPRCPTPP
jgi:hypothetical protein